MIYMHFRIKQITLTFILLSLPGLPVNAQSHIVVGDFENKTDHFALDQWEQSIPDMLQTSLSSSSDLVVLERRRLKTVLEEKALSLSGLTESENAREIGTLLEAEYVIFGSLHETDGEIRIDANIVKVSSGQVRSEKAVSPDREHLQQMVELLSDNIIFNLTGAGEYRERIKISGFPTTYFLAATAGLGIATAVINGHYQNSRDEYQNNTELDRFNDLYDKANRSHKATVFMASLTGTALLSTIYCWMRNRSPREIYASHKHEYSIGPWLALYHQKEVTIGVEIHF